MLVYTEILYLTLVAVLCITLIRAKHIILVLCALELILLVNIMVLGFLAVYLNSCYYQIFVIVYLSIIGCESVIFLSLIMVFLLEFKKNVEYDKEL